MDKLNPDLIHKVSSFLPLWDKKSFSETSKYHSSTVRLSKTERLLVHLVNCIFELQDIARTVSVEITIKDDITSWMVHHDPALGLPVNFVHIDPKGAPLSREQIADAVRSYSKKEAFHIRNYSTTLKGIYVTDVETLMNPLKDVFNATVAYQRAIGAKNAASKLLPRHPRQMRVMKTPPASPSRPQIAGAPALTTDQTLALGQFAKEFAKISPLNAFFSFKLKEGPLTKRLMMYSPVVGDTMFNFHGEVWLTQANTYKYVFGVLYWHMHEHTGTKFDQFTYIFRTMNPDACDDFLELWDAFKDFLSAYKIHIVTKRETKAEGGASTKKSNINHQRKKARPVLGAQSA